MYTFIIHQLLSTNAVCCFTICLKSYLPQQTGPDFKNIPAESTVICQPNTVCHIPMISDKKGGQW